MATRIPSLLFFRLFQGLGAAPGLVLGPGVIGDIYKLEERGRAMSVFLSVSPIISTILAIPIFILQIDMFPRTRVSTSSWRYVSSPIIATLSLLKSPRFDSILFLLEGHAILSCCCWHPSIRLDVFLLPRDRPTWHKGYR